MKLQRFALSLLLLKACTVPAYAQESKPVSKPAEESAGMSPAACAAMAKVKMTKAINTALKAMPGRAVKVELEGRQTGDQRTVGWEVMIVTEDNHLMEVIVDAVTGKVREATEADAEDREELPGQLAALRGTNVPFIQFLSTGMQGVMGVPFEASLALAEEGTTGAVKFLRDGATEQVLVIDRAKRPEPEEEGNEEGESEHGEHGESAKGKKSKKGSKRTKSAGNEEKEEEGNEENESEHGESAKGKKSKKGSKRTKSAGNEEKEEEGNEENESEHGESAKGKKSEKSEKRSKSAGSEEEKEEGAEHGESVERSKPVKRITVIRETDSGLD